MDHRKSEEKGRRRPYYGRHRVGIRYIRACGHRRPNNHGDEPAPASEASEYQSPEKPSGEYPDGSIGGEARTHRRSFRISGAIHGNASGEISASRTIALRALSLRIARNFAPIWTNSRPTSLLFTCRRN